MINKKQAMQILNAGLSTGADFAEIFIEDKVSYSYSIENGKVNVATISNTFGAGLRLLNKLQSVYGYTNDVSLKSLLELANSLSKSFNEERKITVTDLKVKNIKNKHPHLKPHAEVSSEEKIAYLKRGDKVMSEYDPKIMRTQTGLNHYENNITIINSNGFIFKDKKERARMYLMCIASENGKIETGFSGPGASAGFEYFLDKINVEELAKETAQSALTMLSAKECPSGKMPVVIGNAFGGVIFHEACGHSLEATAVAKNNSVFANKLGEKIASSVVTAYDDGTIVNGWGSNNIDDEGNPTQKTLLIEKGILKNYLIDDFNGRRMGMKGNGACRRESYKFEPTSRMSNTYIANGTSTVDEMIKATKLGLYAKSLGGGSVNPATGEFNFSCSEAYIIRDGKVCEPVRGATLIGSGAEILKHIDMVGNDLERAQGMCGSISGSIPVDVGQPTIRVDEILVGGNGGELK
ncbi:MAG TPA: peptidase C69 [Firmicutes bacterium]|nr:peptidase C69 [Bacillota bacterium]